jgi:hypothetical protein
MSVATIIQKADVRQKPRAVRSLFGNASDKNLMEILFPYNREHPSSSEPSIVTGEPTIHIRLFLSMALHTKSHPESHALDPVHRLHPPVASLAQDLFLDMPFMIEKHVFRQIIGLSPRCWRFRVKILVLLFDLGMTSDDILVAVEALLYRRHPGKLGSANVGMTEFTLDLLHP